MILDGGANCFAIRSPGRGVRVDEAAGFADVVDSQGVDSLIEEAGNIVWFGSPNHDI